jgi:hypothetical protein
MARENEIIECPTRFWMHLRWSELHTCASVLPCVKNSNSKAQFYAMDWCIIRSMSKSFDLDI